MGVRVSAFIATLQSLLPEHGACSLLQCLLEDGLNLHRKDKTGKV